MCECSPSLSLNSLLFHIFLTCPPFGGLPTTLAFSSSGEKDSTQFSSLPPMTLPSGLLSQTQQKVYFR